MYKCWYRTQTESYPLPDKTESFLTDIPKLFNKRSPGMTCMSEIKDGANGTVKAPVNDSKGCGGVMRVAPVGLFNSLKYNLLEVDENQRILRCSGEFKNVPLFIDDNIRDCGKLSDKIRKFKQLSKDCHVPVILLTELNNSDEYNKTPRFKSIQRQFDIDDVDKIIFLDKENNSSAIGKDTDITKISIVWNRNGETGEIEVYS